MKTKSKRPEAIWFVPSRADAARKRKESQQRKKEKQLKKTAKSQLPGPVPPTELQQLPAPSTVWSRWAAKLPLDISAEDRAELIQHATVNKQLERRVEERLYRLRRAKERLANQYVVHSIIDERIDVDKKKREFKVVWEGWPRNTASWVAMEDLNCPRVLQAWFKERDSFWVKP